MKLDDLSKFQQRALIELVSFGVFYRVDGGWQYPGRSVHRHSTLKALARRKLCDLTTIGDGAAYPRAAGMKIVREHCEATNKMIRDAGYG